MKICYFNPMKQTPRDRVIIKGLKKNSFDVIECDTKYKSNILIRNLHLINQIVHYDFDVLMLGARGVYLDQYLVPFLKLIKRKPIIFDCVLSIYETRIIDREETKNPIKKFFYHKLDYYALKFSDIVLADTLTHSKYYKKIFSSKIKIETLYIGTDDLIFYPKEHKSKNFSILFWGGYIPLQGVPTIIKAAKLLEKISDIKFILKGFGQDFCRSFELAKKMNVNNIEFDTKWINYEDLPNFIAKADVCLGIFGKSEKAKNVIPNKAYETIAMKKPLITGDSPASREVFVNKENAILCKMNDFNALAESIILLKEDEKLREKIAKGGYETYKNNFTPEKIGQKLKEIINKNIETDE